MEREAFIKTIVPLREELLRQAHRMTRDDDRAEDLVQEVMLRLWNMRASLDNHPNHKALALTILKNKYTDEWRHRQLEVPQAETPLERDTGEQQDSIEAMDQVQIIRWIVNHLPPLQQQIFRMKELEGYEMHEIQEITGCPPDNIRQNLSRARKKIREDFIKITTRRKQPC